MNIQEAKQEIKNALRAYFQKDGNGRYILPSVHQRPLLLMGPPGIGKTAVVEQAAREAGIGLVAYTMTHHTRQSAIGLPRIETRTYQGRTVSVTEYTLSEIVASIYDCMERTGKREGVLFLDEINCVSETLAPTMLQFLQNKAFGNHRIPEGWLIAAAGNPPGYNRSVREFDVVTLDRVRQIDVEPDLEAWMDYARRKQLHGAVLSYLSIRTDRFYRVEQTAGGVFLCYRPRLGGSIRIHAELRDSGYSRVRSAGTAVSAKRGYRQGFRGVLPPLPEIWGGIRYTGHSGWDGGGYCLLCRQGAERLL